MSQGKKIIQLPNATTPLSGSDLIIVEQGGVTKKSTVTAGQAAATAAAAAAQATANSKLSTVATDATLTGNGTVGSPLGVVATQKKYKAYLTIAIGPPPGFILSVTTQIFGANTVGNIVWTIVQQGVLVGTLANAFPAADFWGMVGSSTNAAVTIVSMIRVDDNEININVVDELGNLLTISAGMVFPVDITVEI